MTPCDYVNLYDKSAVFYPEAGGTTVLRNLHTTLPHQTQSYEASNVRSQRVRTFQLHAGARHYLHTAAARRHVSLMYGVTRLDVNLTF